MPGLPGISPSYIIKVVSADGTYHGDLSGYTIESITDELNGFGSCTFSVPTRESSISLLRGYITQREIQVLRSDPGGTYRLLWWGVVVRARANATTVQFQAMGLMWYLSRCHFGPVLTEYVPNGDFESGDTGWTYTGTVTHSVDTSMARLGSQCLKLESSAEDLDNYAETSFSITDPFPAGGFTSYQVAAEFFLEASFASPYIGPASRARGIYVEVYNGGTLESHAGTQLTNSAPRNEWVRMYLPVFTQPTGSTRTIKIRLYSPGGAIHWDMLTMKSSDSVGTGSGGTLYNDLNDIIRNVVDQMLNGRRLHVSVNGPSGSFGGDPLERIYQFSDVAEVWQACFQELINSAIADFAMTWDSLGTTRTLQTYASKGSLRTDLPLTLATNIVDFTLDDDGQNTAAAVTVLSGAGRQQAIIGAELAAARFVGYAEDLSANGGVTFDEVITASAVETPPSGLLQQAQAELAKTKDIVRVPTLTVVDTDAFSLIGVLEVGDVVPVTIDWGYVQEAATHYRVMAWTLTPERETLQLTLGVPAQGRTILPPTPQGLLKGAQSALYEASRRANPPPPHTTQVVGADLTEPTNAQVVAFDDLLGKFVPVNPPDIIYSYAGALTTSTSPAVTPKTTLHATGLSATLVTAGSTTTTVQLLKNGSSVATLTLGSGVTYAHTAISPSVEYVGGTDRFQVEVTAGTGAVDLGGGIELG